MLVKLLNADLGWVAMSVVKLDLVWLTWVINLELCVLLILCVGFLKDFVF